MFYHIECTCMVSITINVQNVVSSSNLLNIILTEIRLFVHNIIIEKNHHSITLKGVSISMHALPCNFGKSCPVFVCTGARLFL